MTWTWCLFPIPSKDLWDWSKKWPADHVWQGGGQSNPLTGTSWFSVDASVVVIPIPAKQVVRMILVSLWCRTEWIIYAAGCLLYGCFLWKIWLDPYFASFNSIEKWHLPSNKMAVLLSRITWSAVTKCICRVYLPGYSCHEVSYRNLLKRRTHWTQTRYC